MKDSDVLAMIALIGKKKIKKLPRSEEHTKLIQLFYENSPEEREKLLTNIDTVLCSMLDLEPWLNPNQHNHKWEKIMTNLRLVVGKIEFEAAQKARSVH
jgi:hypothetical protein